MSNYLIKNLPSSAELVQADSSSFNGALAGLSTAQEIFDYIDNNMSSTANKNATLGLYDSTWTYDSGAFCFYNNKIYYSLAGSNLNNQPDTSSAQWRSYLEVEFVASLPATGVSGRIYIRSSDWSMHAWSGTAYEVLSGGGSGSVWGSITGTLSDQTDLQTALNGKSNTSHTHSEYSLTTHAHDDRYYTETETNSLLSGKSDTTHNHDLAYADIAYEESVNNILATKEPTGFPNLTDSTMSFVNGTRTFTIQPTGASFDVYQSGIKYTISTPKTIVISATEGTHHIYFDVGVLYEVTTLTEDIIKNKAYIASIYWDNINLVQIMLSDERHGFRMDGDTHYYLHNTIGSAFVSGAVLGNFVVDGNGSLASHAQFSVASGIFFDEDITFNLNSVVSTTGLDIYYLLGTTNWRKITNAGYSVTTTGTGRLAYNQNIAGNWQLTEVTNNQFALCHVFMTNDFSRKYIAVVGQNTYTTLSAARQGALTEILNLINVGLPFQEFIEVGTVIFQTSNTYSNAVKARIVSTEEGDNYIDFRYSKTSSNSFSATNHNDLSGREATDSHPATAISYDNSTSGLTSTNVKSAIDELKVLAGNNVTSVNGETGVVVLDKDDIGLGNVDNTSDANKPISTATQTALNGKSDTTHTHADLHTHTNKAVLDDIIDSGDGNSFLANDGTYKTVSSGSASWGGITGTLSSQTDLQSALNSKSNTTHTHDYNYLNTQPLKKTLLYYGYPTSINEVWSVEGAVAVYANYDVIIFGDGYQNSAHEENQNMIDVITQLKALKPNIQIFGYIPIGLGVSGANLTMTILKARADEWLACGATGVFLDEFGYDYSVTRDRQNEIVDYAHGLSLNVIANSWTLDHAFSKENIIIDWLSNFAGNPNLLESELNENDYYLFEHLFWQLQDVTGNQLNGGNNWKIYEAVRYNQDVDQGGYTSGETYRQIFGTQLMVLDGIGDARTDKESLFLQSYIGSLIINVDAYCASVSNWGADNTNYIHYKFDFVDLKENTRHTTVMGDYNGTYKKFTATINGITFDLYWDREADLAITNGTSRIDQDGVTRTHLYVSTDELYITKVDKTTTINGFDLSANRTLTQDNIGNGSTYVRTTNDYTSTEKTKLSGITTGANLVSTTASTISALYTFTGGNYIYSANYGFNNAASSDKYLRIFRLKFTQNFGRAYITMPVVITGTQTKKGTLNLYMYESTLKTINSGSKAFIINMDSANLLFGTTDFYYQQWTGTTNDYIDVWVKITDYARFVHNIDYIHMENGVTITINPDNATTSDGVGLQSSIPAAASTSTYDGESVTASASVAFSVLNAMPSTLTSASNADSLHKHAEITEQRASTQMKVWYGTTAQYTAIGTKDANTIYFCS
jgi:hypothetical protein